MNFFLFEWCKLWNIRHPFTLDLEPSGLNQLCRSNNIWCKLVQFQWNYDFFLHKFSCINHKLKFYTKVVWIYTKWSSKDTTNLKWKTTQFVKSRILFTSTRIWFYWLTLNCKLLTFKRWTRWWHWSSLDEFFCYTLQVLKPKRCAIWTKLSRRGWGKYFVSFFQLLILPLKN